MKLRKGKTSIWAAVALSLLSVGVSAVTTLSWFQMSSRTSQLIEDMSVTSGSSSTTVQDVTGYKYDYDDFGNGIDTSSGHVVSYSARNGTDDINIAEDTSKSYIDCPEEGVGYYIKGDETWSQEYGNNRDVWSYASAMRMEDKYGKNRAYVYALHFVVNEQIKIWYHTFDSAARSTNTEITTLNSQTYITSTGASVATSTYATVTNDYSNIKFARAGYYTIWINENNLISLVYEGASDPLSRSAPKLQRNNKGLGQQTRATLSAHQKIYVRPNGWQADGAILKANYQDSDNNWHKQTMTSITTKGNENLYMVDLDYSAKNFQVLRINPSDPNDQWNYSALRDIPNGTNIFELPSSGGWNGNGDFYKDKEVKIWYVTVGSPSNGSITVGNKYGSESGSGYYYSDWTLTLTATPNTGYNWSYYTANGSNAGISESDNSWSLTQDTTFSAVFTVSTIYIRFNVYRKLVNNTAFNATKTGATYGNATALYTYLVSTYDYTNYHNAASVNPNIASGTVYNNGGKYTWSDTWHLASISGTTFDNNYTVNLATNSEANPIELYTTVLETPITVTVKKTFRDRGKANSSSTSVGTIRFGAVQTFKASLFSSNIPQLNGTDTNDDCAYTCAGYSATVNGSVNANYTNNTGVVFGGSSDPTIFAIYNEDKFTVSLYASCFDISDNHVHNELLTTYPNVYESSGNYAVPTYSVSNFYWNDENNGIFYIFARSGSDWYTDQDCKNRYTGNSPVGANTPLYAKCVDNTTKITLYVNVDAVGFSDVYVYSFNDDGIQGTGITSNGGPKALQLPLMDPYTNIYKFTIPTGTTAIITDGNWNEDHQTTNIGIAASDTDSYSTARGKKEYISVQNIKDSGDSNKYKYKWQVFPGVPITSGSKYYVVGDSTFTKDTEYAWSFYSAFEMAPLSSGSYYSGGFRAVAKNIELDAGMEFKLWKFDATNGIDYGDGTGSNSWWNAICNNSVDGGETNNYVSLDGTSGNFVVKNGVSGKFNIYLNPGSGNDGYVMIEDANKGGYIFFKSPVGDESVTKFRMGPGDETHNILVYEMGIYLNEGAEFAIRNRNKGSFSWYDFDDIFSADYATNDWIYNAKGSTTTLGDTLNGSSTGATKSVDTVKIKTPGTYTIYVTGTGKIAMSHVTNQYGYFIQGSAQTADYAGIKMRSLTTSGNGNVAMYTNFTVTSSAQYRFIQYFPRWNGGTETLDTIVFKDFYDAATGSATTEGESNDYYTTANGFVTFKPGHYNIYIRVENNSYRVCISSYSAENFFRMNSISTTRTTAESVFASNTTMILKVKISTTNKKNMKLYVDVIATANAATGLSSKLKYVMAVDETIDGNSNSYNHMRSTYYNDVDFATLSFTNNKATMKNGTLNSTTYATIAGSSFTANHYVYIMLDYNPSSVAALSSLANNFYFKIRTEQV